ncbi:hypothetical protein CG709_08485, partial [Lachnotalea glycerini]
VGGAWGSLPFFSSGASVVFWGRLFLGIVLLHSIDWRLLMKEKTADRRIRKTKYALKKGLTELMSIKSFKEISVKELTEKVDLNRGTFYLHYKTPNDLLTQLENELFDIIYTSYQNHNLLNPYEFFLSLYQSLKEHSDFSKALLKSNSGKIFWERISQEIKREYYILWTKEYQALSDRELEYFATFLVDGYLAVLKLWLANGMTESPKEMVHLIQKFICNVKNSN